MHDISVEILKKQSNCDCKVPCSLKQYQPSLSFAQLSKFNIDRMVLNDPVRRALVNDKFLHAQEISQRVIIDVAKEDERKLLAIKKLLNLFWQDIQEVAPALSSDGVFAQKYDILSMVEYGDDLFRADLIAQGLRLAMIGELFAPVLTTKLMYIDRYLPAAMSTLLELTTNSSGLIDKLMPCVLTPGAITFPVPEYYGDVKGYFDANSRRKRSHANTNPTLDIFYAVTIPEYDKLKTLVDCNDYLSLKQDLADELVQQRSALDIDRDHINTIYSSFKDFFDFMYKNTSKSRYDFPKYMSCMAVLENLNNTLWKDIDNLSLAMGAFAQGNNSVDILSTLTNLAGMASTSTLPLTAAYTVTGQLYLNCYWPYFEYFSEKDLGEDFLKWKMFFTEMSNAYISYPTIRVSMGNLADYATNMYSLMEQVIMPQLSVTDAYLANHVTKMDMAQVFDSALLNKALQDLVSYGADFISIAREFDQRLKSSVHNVIVGYSLLFNMTFPMVDNDVLWNFEVIKHALNSNVTHIIDIVNKFKTEPNMHKVFLEFMYQINYDYSSSIARLKLRLPFEIDELIKSIDIALVDLIHYIEDNEMNQGFFMENFVQVDVFYKRLHYEKLSFHESFPFLSLLSEVGGFMGLLLGASALTLCEIFDYVVLLAFRKLSKTRVMEHQKIIDDDLLYVTVS